jgi:hypothetical protein
MYQSVEEFETRLNENVGNYQRKSTRAYFNLRNRKSIVAGDDYFHRSFYML